MTGVVTSLGPLGIFLLMVPESACVPVPSELTLMSAGFGVHQGWFGFPIAVAAATAGNLVGSLIAYALGRNAVIAQLLTKRRSLACERLFADRGDWAVFFGRLLPLARSFVSVPAGHARVPIVRFVVLTVAGCAIWSAGFVVAGMLAGSGWKAVGHDVSQVGLVAGLATVATLVFVSARRRT